LVKSAVDKQPNVAGNQKNTEDGQAVGDIHIFRSPKAATAEGNDMRVLRGCQRLAVGTAPPYNRGAGSFHCECCGGRDEFASAAFQKRRTG
jgi:hypothetical protein